MSRVPTQVIKAREVEVAFVIDERDTDDIINLDRLRHGAVRDFGGRAVDVKLTDYLTVHNVIAIDSIKFEPAKHTQQNYLIGDSSPRKSTVTVKLILDAAKIVKPFEETLIERDSIELPTGSMKELR